jgi:hypothetical protein
MDCRPAVALRPASVIAEMLAALSSVGNQLWLLLAARQISAATAVRDFAANLTVLLQVCCMRDRLAILAKHCFGTWHVQSCCAQGLEH